MDLSVLRTSPSASPEHSFVHQVYFLKDFPVCGGSGSCFFPARFARRMCFIARGEGEAVFGAVAARTCRPAREFSVVPAGALPLPRPPAPVSNLTLAKSARSNCTLYQLQQRKRKQWLHWNLFTSVAFRFGVVGIVHNDYGCISQSGKATCTSPCVRYRGQWQSCFRIRSSASFVDPFFPDQPLYQPSTPCPSDRRGHIQLFLREAGKALWRAR